MRQSEFRGDPIDAPLTAVLTNERANPMGHRSVAAAQGLLQADGEADRDAYLRALVADAVRHLDLGPHAIDVIQGKRSVIRVDALPGGGRYTLREEDAGCGPVAKSGGSESSVGRTAG